jgi:hypothetical protein
LQLIVKDTASLNGNCGPPLIPMNWVPSSTKLPDKIEPGSPGPAPVLRLKLSMCEFGNTEV